MTRSDLGGDSLSGLHDQVTDRNFRKEPRGKITVQKQWRNTAYWLALGLIPTGSLIQDFLPMNGTAYSGLGPPAPINNEYNLSQPCP